MATFTDEELAEHYHRCKPEDDCRAHDKHAGWSHHEMIRKLNDIRKYVGAKLRCPGRDECIC